MNEDVFPIQHGGFFSNVMLVFRGVNLDLDFAYVGCGWKKWPKKILANGGEIHGDESPDPSKMASFWAPKNTPAEYSFKPFRWVLGDS